MTLARALIAELDDEALDELAAVLAPRLQAITERIRPVLPVWLNAKQAAEYLAAPVSRIHDLVGLGELEPRRDGRRLLFRRADLDAYLEVDR